LDIRADSAFFACVIAMPIRMLLITPIESFQSQLGLLRLAAAPGSRGRCAGEPDFRALLAMPSSKPLPKAAAKNTAGELRNCERQSITAGAPCLRTGPAAPEPPGAFRICEFI
jgi:hypothetical protein